MKGRTLWIGLLVLVVLTPLGLWLPEKFHAGPAWGEWSLTEVKKLVGYVPKGMQRSSDLWRAPLPDYEAPRLRPALGYVLSALIGAGVALGIAFLLGRALAKGKSGEAGPTNRATPPPGKR